VILRVHAKRLGLAHLLSVDDDTLTGCRLTVRTRGNAHARQQAPLGAIAKQQDQEGVLDPDTG
jgi:hypothetical protein